MRGNIDHIVSRIGVGIVGEWDYALYTSPPSHDFLTWLVTAELMRREHGALPPLKVALFLKDGQLGLLDYGNVSFTINPGGYVGLSRAYSNTMIAHVLRPAMDMIGAVSLPHVHAPVEFEDIEHFCEYAYFPTSIVDASRAGFEIPFYYPPEWAIKETAEFLNGKKPIVITLRESQSQLKRNSNLEAWLKFAETIAADFPVLFVRDTEKAEDSLGPWRTYPKASTNAYIRLALYRQAFCNMMVGNGPMEWCTHSDAPYLMFKQLNPEMAAEGWVHGSVKGWEQLTHLTMNDQMPWHIPSKQKLTWKDDTFENIMEEFEGHVYRSRGECGVPPIPGTMAGRDREGSR